tara:strand:+ start:211 stop:789 length:579 start_codon:yes stop_codon:yes gene_type:complete
MNDVSSTLMFSIPLLKTRITRRKRKQILNAIDKSNTDYKLDGSYFTDFDIDTWAKRQNGDASLKSNDTPYCHEVWNLLFNDVSALFDQMGMKLKKSTTPVMWSQKYYAGNLHGIHNHGAYGYSCILYLKFNPKVHKATRFYSPFNHFLTGDLLCFDPQVEEGDLIMFPSTIAHESQTQDSSEERMILSFNIK